MEGCAPGFVGSVVVVDSPAEMAGVHSTRITASVRFSRTRWDSVEPVDETFCTRRIAAARTLSPLTFYKRTDLSVSGAKAYLLHV